jgi:hypothetical protein
VRHATPATIAELGPLLEKLRALPGLREPKPGTFYRGSVAFLHFHEDPAGLFADLKRDGEFARFRATTARERADLVRAAREALAATPGRAPARPRPRPSEGRR